MNDHEKKLKLLSYVRELVKGEEELRQKYNIGDGYRSISNRFKALLRHIEENVELSESELANLVENNADLAENQQYVYVYLFNAQGRILSRWVPMFSPRNFAEYSVNRPIYQEEDQVQAYIRSRTNDDAHAYLVMKVNKGDVVSSPGQAHYHDATGQPLLKLKEKSLMAENLVVFVYKGDRYRVSNGQLILESHS